MANNNLLTPQRDACVAMGALLFWLQITNLVLVSDPAHKQKCGNVEDQAAWQRRNGEQEPAQAQRQRGKVV